MKYLVKKILAVMLVSAVLVTQGFAADSPYPSKPVKIVVPWPAGGLVDIAARLVSVKLQAGLGEPFIIENKPGAGGALGADVVAKSEDNGYNLLLSTSALNMSVALGIKTPFDFTRDFTPVSLVAFAPSFLVVHTSSNIKTVQDLIASAKAKPGKLFYASAGQGTPAHLSGELLKSIAGLDVVHVPYKGGPPAMLDQIAGRVDFHFANASVALPQIQSGKLRALAVTSTTRFSALPDVPTMIEAGVPNFEADQWLAIFVRAGTPSLVIEKLRLEIQKILMQDQIKASMTSKGMSPAPANNSNDLKNYLKEDLNKWTSVVKSANIQMN